jgi:hypothetical protein
VPSEKCCAVAGSGDLLIPLLVLAHAIVYIYICVSHYKMEIFFQIFFGGGKFYLENWDLINSL